jgi:hypothetical protein
MTIGEQSRTPETHAVSAATIDAAGWGVFFIWLGFAFLTGVGWGVGLLGVGIIALAAQAARRYVGLKVDRFGLTLGIVFVVAGLYRLFDVPIPSQLVPLVLIVIGVFILSSAWLRRPKQ